MVELDHLSVFEFHIRKISGTILNGQLISVKKLNINCLTLLLYLKLNHSALILLLCIKFHHFCLTLTSMHSTQALNNGLTLDFNSKLFLYEFSFLIQHIYSTTCHLFIITHPSSNLTTRPYVKLPSQICCSIGIIELLVSFNIIIVWTHSLSSSWFLLKLPLTNNPYDDQLPVSLPKSNGALCEIDPFLCFPDVSPEIWKWNLKRLFPDFRREHFQYF